MKRDRLRQIIQEEVKGYLTEDAKVKVQFTATPSEIDLMIRAFRGGGISSGEKKILEPIIKKMEEAVKRWQI